MNSSINRDTLIDLDDLTYRVGRHEKRGRHERIFGFVQLKHHWTTEQAFAHAQQWLGRTSIRFRSE